MEAVDRGRNLFPRSFKEELPLAVRAEGLYIYDEEGNRYIDGCSGALISSLGHGVREVTDAISEQLRTLSFAHPSRWRNRAIEEAAEEVASVTPGDLNYVWFVSGGSEATESAVKMARQYFIEKEGEGTSRHLVIGRWNSYHGSTLGSMAFGGNVPRRRFYSPMFKDHPKIQTHYCYRCPFGLDYPSCDVKCARELENAIKITGPQYVAAFIAEPVVGSTVGALVPPDEYWPTIRDICDKYGVLLIADEVMTGFGRTGKAFGVDHWNVVPDIMAAAKAMAAGYVPTGGVFASEKVVEVFRKGSGVFVHGHTYNGNPLSGAATAATLRYMKKNGLFENARMQGEILGEALESLVEIPIVGEVRGKGLMRGVEIVSEKVSRNPFPRAKRASAVVTAECIRRGLVIYPSGGMVDGVDGDNFMIAPPLNVTSEQVGEIVAILKEGLNAASDILLTAPV
ncbi:MAG TPA: aminotransferase class III-fold pyridoxal phosphate-dependent enzyme [Synergistales bacterium]|jgi:adenosylmethionine-8-amino-7-oxononanoate aminotransferase|nr:aminotransferase class III-fold pyridoxal phosphate-dependent enzyme [Synergistaceae bacterium]NLV64638.1 aminotransferase class III-fold pyridoxal phosphate-dependent enzyme [Synergistaceae bacterium]HOI80872.1 aminotransferase class III-fold pyridoxal phosphate-dependent enzyme [Synergistales bacterium]